MKTIFLTEKMKKDIIKIIDEGEYNFWHGKSFIIINFIAKYKKEIKNNEDIKFFILKNLNIENIEKMYNDPAISNSLKNEIQNYLYSIPIFNEVKINEEGKEQYNYVKNLTENIINKLEY